MTSRVTLAVLPSTFNGDKSKWESFADSLLTYLAAYDDELDTDKKKVFFTISLLRSSDGSGCAAADWVRNWKRRNLQNGTLVATYTFASLFAEMEAAFKDQNLAQVAHLRLTTTRQGKMSFSEFIQQFELYAEQAGYPVDGGSNDRFLIELLEDLVNNEIISQIYLGGVALPTTYKAFKERLVQVDGNRQRSLIRQSRRGVPVLTRTPMATSPPRQQFSGATPNLSKSLENGPVPMDVDRQGQKTRPFKCYNCGKTGHMRRNCPEPSRQKFNLRALCAEIDAEDKDSDILKQLAAKLREKGF